MAGSRVISFFFFSLDAAAIAEAPAGLRIAEPSFVNPNQGHGRHG